MFCIQMIRPKVMFRNYIFNQSCNQAINYKLESFVIWSEMYKTSQPKYIEVSCRIHNCVQRYFFFPSLFWWLHSTRILYYFLYKAQWFYYLPQKSVLRSFCTTFLFFYSHELNPFCKANLLLGFLSCLFLKEQSQTQNETYSCNAVPSFLLNWYLQGKYNWLSK